MIHSYLLNIGKGTTRLLSRILLIAAVGSIPVLAQVTQVTTCGTVIDHPGTYILANDLSCHDSAPVAPVTAARNSFEATLRSLRNPITGSPIVLPNLPSGSDGIDIVSNHVILLLDGHTIDGGGTGQFGITVGLGETPGNSHVQIVGPGTVKGFGAGVQLVQTSFSSISEVTAPILLLILYWQDFHETVFPVVPQQRIFSREIPPATRRLGFSWRKLLTTSGRRRGRRQWQQRGRWHDHQQRYRHLSVDARYGK